MPIPLPHHFCPLPESDYNMPGLDKTDTEGNENKEAVLEEAADDFSLPHFFTFEAEASHNHAC